MLQITYRNPLLLIFLLTSIIEFEIIDVQWVVLMPVNTVMVKKKRNFH